MWWSGETGRMQIHSYVAYVLITLVVTRLTWGFVGSYHSRFSNFVVGPSKIARYVTQGDDGVGHNPLGALSTVALLLVLLAQGVSGLFSVDDVAFDGPLAYAFDGVLIDAASEWHETNWGNSSGALGAAFSGNCMVPVAKETSDDSDNVARLVC
jgi:cytochrome b